MDVTRCGTRGRSGEPIPAVEAEPTSADIALAEPGITATGSRFRRETPVARYSVTEGGRTGSEIAKGVAATKNEACVREVCESVPNH